MNTYKIVTTDRITIVLKADSVEITPYCLNFYNNDDKSVLIAGFHLTCVVGWYKDGSLVSTEQTERKHTSIASYE